MAEKVTIGNCDLWHGDSLEVLGLIRETVDAVVTDRPTVAAGSFAETAPGRQARSTRAVSARASTPSFPATTETSEPMSTGARCGLRAATP